MSDKTKQAIEQREADKAEAFAPKRQPKPKPKETSAQGQS